MKQTPSRAFFSILIIATAISSSLFISSCRPASNQTANTQNTQANSQPSPSESRPQEAASLSPMPAPENSPAQVSPTPSPTATIINPSQTPLVINPSHTPSVINPSQPSPTAPTKDIPSLIIPVSGVRAAELHDTFTEARSEGRVHDAIDIIAAQGTPVLAAADGKIVKLFESVRGGTTIYQLCTDNKTILYYAHLQRYADGIAEGRSVRQGEVIAYVGDTGNAGAGNFHLHFSVSIVSDPKRWWSGINVNPYPLLKK